MWRAEMNSNGMNQLMWRGACRCSQEALRAASYLVLSYRFPFRKKKNVPNHAVCLRAWKSTNLLYFIGILISSYFIFIWNVNSLSTTTTTKRVVIKIMLRILNFKIFHYNLVIIITVNYIRRTGFSETPSIAIIYLYFH